MNIHIIGPGLLAVLLLTACNNVSSEAALFTREAAADGPALREGMWGVRKEGCVLTASGRPPSGCTPPIAISAALIGDEGVGMPYVLIAGDPAVAQLTVRDPKEHKTTWYYWAVEPIARDPAGRVTEAWIWPVQCGPLAPPPGGEKAFEKADGEAAAPDAATVPPAARDAAPTAPPPADEPGGGEASGEDAPEEATSGLFAQLMAAMVTQEPYDGLTMTSLGCTATRGDAVLAAAAASRGWYPSKLEFYWVGDKGTMVALGPAVPRLAR